MIEMKGIYEYEWNTEMIEVNGKRGFNPTERGD
jgi:hypothetical protein